MRMLKRNGELGHAIKRWFSFIPFSPRASDDHYKPAASAATFTTAIHRMGVYKMQCVFPSTFGDTSDIVAFGVYSPL